MNTLLITIGLPRSGKSTWAKQQGCPVVSGDSIRLALHGQPYILEAEPMVSCVKKLMVRALFLAGHSTVILDGTHTTRKRRDEWISPYWQRVFILIGGPADQALCLERAQKTCRDAQHFEDLTSEIRRMAKNYSPPGFDEITCDILRPERGLL